MIDLDIRYFQDNVLYNAAIKVRMANRDPRRLGEDNIFGVLGLAAALKADPDRSNADQIAAGIAATKSLLPLGIDTDGSVWGHLWLSSVKHTVYGGRMLTAFSGITVDGDMNMDDVINLEDVSIFTEDWLDDCACKGDVNEDQPRTRSGEFILLCDNTRRERLHHTPPTVSTSNSTVQRV